jgi:peptidyl-tRNA hydrolase, PTH1 family
MTWLVVGLGNPGQEYATTRHNAGFMVVDLLADTLRATYWKDEGGARTAAVRLGDHEIVLVEPQTYANPSGKAVAKLAAGYDLGPSRVLVVHDDLDLLPADVRVKRGGGHGGHNGLRSITDSLGTGEYPRVRIGIGRPPGRMDPADYVLEPMRGAAAEELAAAIPTAAEAVVYVVERGVDDAMRQFNGA